MIKPMLPSFSQPFSDPQYIFEPKWDGIRALYNSGKFINRNGKNITHRFPEFKTLLSHSSNASLWNG